MCFVAVSLCMASWPFLCHRGTMWVLFKQSLTQTSCMASSAPPVRWLLQFSFKVDPVWVFGHSTDTALCCMTWEELLAFGSMCYPSCILSLQALVLLFSLSGQAWRPSFLSSPLAGQWGARVARYNWVQSNSKNACLIMQQLIWYVGFVAKEKHL